MFFGCVDQTVGLERVGGGGVDPLQTDVEFAVQISADAGRFGPALQVEAQIVLRGRGSFCNA